jgi:hypothetical protein
MQKENAMKTKKSIRRGLAFISLTLLLVAGFALVFSSCLSSPSETGSGWTVTINGIRSDGFDQGYFEEAKVHENHYVTVVLEKKGTMHTYQGMPLWLVVAMADGYDNHHPFAFDDGLWSDGYDVTLTASDGYAATFSTLDIGPDDLIIADTEDGVAISPSIVGDVSSKLWIKDLAIIDLGLMQTAAEEKPFELIVDINGTVQQYTLAELEQSPYYIEEKGSYTTSAGTTYVHQYGGVKFGDFLQQFLVLENDTAVTMVAMDGYEMTYSGEQILDDSSGLWLLAFKSDGEYMPVDPGYVRTVKVGPSLPDIEGHLSVRMIQKIVASGEEFKEFTLIMNGEMDSDIDRQTFESCASCHSTTVTYVDKKSGEENSYTGVALWRLNAYSDDELYAPHKQDTSIISYNEDAALEGYQVEIIAADGYSITLDSKELNFNQDVIIAMYKNDELLSEREWPLVIVWDKDAEIIPDGIKSVRNLEGITLLF